MKSDKVPAAKALPKAGLTLLNSLLLKLLVKQSYGVEEKIAHPDFRIFLCNKMIEVRIYGVFEGVGHHI